MMLSRRLPVPEHAVIGYCHPGTVRAEFCASLLATAMEGRTPLDSVLTYQSGPNISTARNKIVHDFLTRQRAPWLLMVDTDMVFAGDALDRLVAAADPVERPLLGALCFSQDGDASYPVMYELGQNANGSVAFVRYTTWPEDACQRVSATGAAFLLMHRGALEKIQAVTEDKAAPWFREMAVAPLALMGEDMTFCLRAAAADIPVYVHTGIQVGHMKPVMLGKVG
jgi:GT2 family glycosyltransferase